MVTTGYTRAEAFAPRKNTISVLQAIVTQRFVSLPSFYIVSAPLNL